MRIGVRAHDFGPHTPHELVAILKEYGFTAAQLAVPKAIVGVKGYAIMEDSLCAQIARAFSDANIEISVLGCYIEPSLPDNDARMAQLELFYAALSKARALGAKRVGTETTAFRLAESERENTYHILKTSVLLMTERAAKENISVAIEPVRTHTLHTPELTARLLREINSPHLSIIFDPVNLLSPATVQVQNRLWKECFEAFGAHISAVHLKDVVCRDGAFIPCPLGEGIVDFSAIMPWLRMNKPDVSLLREELRPETARQDIQFMRNLIEGKKS